METFFLIKAGFWGFAISIGVLMLVFYSAGIFLKVSYRYFNRVFLLASIFSFLAVDLFLFYKIVGLQIPSSQLFLVGCIGGWSGGIIFGLTQMKPLLGMSLK